MEYWSSECGPIPAIVQSSRFRGDDGVDEYHLLVRPTEGGRSDTQLECVRQGYRQALAEFGLDAGTVLWRRFFCSDLAGQAALAAQPFSDPRDRRALRRVLGWSDRRAAGQGGVVGIPCA